MNIKNDIYLTLLSNIIKEFLKNYSNINNEILFSESDCSGYKSIRFSTLTLENEFKPAKKNIGYFKNGHFIYFEIKPEIDLWNLYLNVSKVDMPYEYFLKLDNISDNVIFQNESMAVLYKKELCNINDDSQMIINKLNEFLEKELNSVVLSIFIEKNTEINEISENNYINDKVLYIEGTMNLVFNNKYERNQQARQKCIEYYGTKCQICGFDFAKVYGDEFKGKIHVHHKVPLHKIKKEYVVDPIKDLIPVCPNCHMVLHSKEEGTYTVEEIKKRINKF